MVGSDAPIEFLSSSLPVGAAGGKGRAGAGGGRGRLDLFTQEEGREESDDVLDVGLSSEREDVPMRRRRLVGRRQVIDDDSDE